MTRSWEWRGSHGLDGWTETADGGPRCFGHCFSAQVRGSSPTGGEAVPSSTRAEAHGWGAERLPSAAVSTATPAAPPAGSLLGKVERTAWRVPLPTRQLFVTLALVAAAALALSGLVAGWVANRNANTIDDAREQGLDSPPRSPTSAPTWRRPTHGGGHPDRRRPRVHREPGAVRPGPLEASRALTDAGLVARAEDREDIRAMANGLVTYAGVVETSRANSASATRWGRRTSTRPGPGQRRPRAARRTTAARGASGVVAQASNSVGGPLSVLSILLLVAAVVVLAGAPPSSPAFPAGHRPSRPGGSAGRHRRRPGVMLYGIVSQANDLRRAAGDEIDPSSPPTRRRAGCPTSASPRSRRWRPGGAAPPIRRVRRAGG